MKKIVNIFQFNEKKNDVLKKWLLEPKIPKHISKNFKKITQSELDIIQLSLKEHYFSDCPKGYLSTEYGYKDLVDHLINRLQQDRKFVIPWLDEAKTLKDSDILEIGCGTGCSTVALAEQGARVTAVDLDQKSLTVAKDRCRIYGLDVDFFKINAIEVDKIFSGKHFDFIIFYASLEHMTLQERMTAMKKTWDMLSSGDLWCVIETPNRLWYYDSHTSLLPFYLWLPDDLAFKYSCFSPRDSFRNLYKEYNEESKFHFLRRGRGVSYHEFELTMKPVDQLNIVSSMPIFYRKKNILRWLKWRFSLGYRYESLLSKIYPKIHRGFYQPYLYLIIKKN